MFEPIILAGRFTTTIDGIDNDAINELVLKRKDMKLDDTPGNTFQEDSYLPTDKEPVKKLLNEVDTIIQKNINMNFETVNQWAHILQPNESTMIHTHDKPGMPPQLSWVFILRQIKIVAILYGRQQYIISLLAWSTHLRLVS